MEEAKKQNNLGFLFAMLKIIGIIVAVVAVVVLGIYFYVRVILGIDIFGIINIVKKMGKDFDETTMITTPITEDSTTLAFEQFDLAGLSGFYTVENGEYKINDDISGLTAATQEIQLTDVQVASLVQSLLNSSAQIGEDLELDITLKQITFSNLTTMANGNKVDVNVVFHTSLKELKSAINVFPVSLFIKYIPNDAYVSVNFSIEQTDATTYKITPKNIKLNSLTADQTSQVISVIGSVVGNTSSRALCEDIGDLVFQALIGNDNGPGLVRELDVVGITGFAFETVGTDIKFILKI